MELFFGSSAGDIREWVTDHGDLSQLPLQRTLTLRSGSAFTTSSRLEPTAPSPSDGGRGACRYARWRSQNARIPTPLSGLARPRRDDCGRSL